MRRTLLVACLVVAVVSVAEPVLRRADGEASVTEKVTRHEVRTLRAAAARTLAAGPRRYVVEVALDLPAEIPAPGRTVIPFRAEGIVDPATGASVATFEVLSDPHGEEPDTTLQIVAPPQEVTYVGSESFTLPSGAQWVEVPTARLQSATSTTSALAYASDFVGHPRFVGPYEARGGVKTRHYVVDVPVRTIVESGGIPADAAASRDLRRLERAGRGTAPVNLWLDADGRIVMYATYVSFAIKGDGPELAVNGEYYDFGTELGAAPPPPEQVVPLDAVADQLEPFLGPVDP
jgi:hypothetical protein